MTVRHEETTPDQRLIDALRLSAQWHLLGLLFERPQPGWLRRLEALATEVDDARLRAAVGAAADATEHAYLATLGPGAPASPRAVAHQGELTDPGRVLADIRAFYEAFHFRPVTEDPADHVEVMAGFIGYLYLKQALAWMADAGTEAALVSDAIGRFAATHLAKTSEQIKDRLEALEAPPYLVEAARCLFWSARRATSADPGGPATRRGTVPSRP